MSTATAATSLPSPATFYSGVAGFPIPGGITLRFWLVQAPGSSVVTGHAEIDQAVNLSAGRIVISHVVGHIYNSGFGPNQLLIGFTGETLVSLPPPAIGSYLTRLLASFTVDARTGNGTGQWTLNSVQHDVPVVLKSSHT